LLPLESAAAGDSSPYGAAPGPEKPKQLSSQPLEVLACDNIERIRDGLCRYIVTFIALLSHFRLRLGCTRRGRPHVRADRYRALVLPQNTQDVNAHAIQPHPSRILRGDHEELLFTGLALFNRKLAPPGLVFSTPSAPTIPSARNHLYPSSPNANPSAKNTGRIQPIGFERDF
jgi:hypothetical protein